MLGVIIAVGGFVSFLGWAWWMLWRSYKGAQGTAQAKQKELEL